MSRFPAFAAASLALLAPVSAGAADRPGQPQACFTAEQLNGRPKELHPVKGPRQFDADVPPGQGTPAARVAGRLEGQAVRSVRLPKGEKVIALTFDFCEQTGEIAGYDGAIVDALRAERVKATLFLGGKWMRSHGERTGQLIADPLFEIASHGWSHKNLRLLAGSDLQREVQGPQRAFEAARAELLQQQCFNAVPDAAASLQPRIGLFRFPFGACNAESLATVNAAGLVPIQWSISTGDASPAQSAAAITASVLRAARPGAIVLMHGNGRGYNTAAALPAMIRQLRGMGYRFATVGELMRMGEPELVPTCYDARPGDTDRYDRLFPAVATRRAGPRESRDGWQPVTVPR